MSQNPSTDSKGKILSIQSHVVHGYVGNKSATFPLQLLGFEVDAINSVQFSNHTGYEHIRGQVLNEKDLATLFEGLSLNDLLHVYTHLLTGYIGNALFLKEVAKIIKKLREINPNIIYVCDPVMGDNGEMYVPKELLPIYRDEIIPLADVITPNQFELELILEKKIANESEAWEATRWFHDRGVKIVALSSTDLGEAGIIKTLLSHKNGKDIHRYSIDIPKQGEGISFVGTGDLYASLLLAHSTLCKDLGEALEFTVATLQAILKRTIEGFLEEMKRRKHKPISKDWELKLIQSKRDIEEPQVLLKSKRL